MILKYGLYNWATGIYEIKTTLKKHGRKFSRLLTQNPADDWPARFCDSYSD